MNMRTEEEIRRALKLVLPELVADEESGACIMAARYTLEWVLGRNDGPFGGLLKGLKAHLRARNN